VSADDTRPDLSVPLDEYAAIRGASEAPAAPLDRETLGRLVHDVRLARNAMRDRPFGLLPWEERSEEQREMDRRIGASIAAHAAAVTAVRMNELGRKETEDAVTAERERIAALLDDLASASGGPSHFAYRNAAHLIRQERSDEKGPTP
jgi:hypothetical protein